MNEPTEPDKPQAKALSAEDMYKQAMNIINESIQSCHIEGFDSFDPPPLHVAQPVTQNNFADTQQLQKTDYFALAKDLFNQQESLFSEPEAEPQQAGAEPQPQQAGAEPQPQPQQAGAEHPEAQPATPPNPTADAEESPLDESLNVIHNMFNGL